MWSNLSTSTFLVITFVLIGFIYVYSYQYKTFSRQSILLHILESTRREGNSYESSSSSSFPSKSHREKKEFTKNNQRNERGRREGMKEWQSGNSISQANNRPRGRRRCVILFFLFYLFLKSPKLFYVPLLYVSRIEMILGG